jgi:hypothetical protein
MPKGDEEHGSITSATSILPSGRDERVNFLLGQVLAGAQVGILWPPWCDCLFLNGWGDKREVRVSHSKSVLCADYSS